MKDYLFFLLRQASQGKKWFAFTKMNDLTATELTNRI